MTEDQRKKICVVVQRYGLEVNGGAELLARQIAEKLASDNEVTVLTSKAVDYITWEDVYSNSVETLNEVNIVRFSVEHPRDIAIFNGYNGRFLNGEMPPSEELKWIQEEGPFIPEMVGYLRDNHDKYDVFLFFTYLYYPTVVGVPEVADKAIVFPLAHDEPFLNMQIFDNVFTLPKAFVFETEEERKLIRDKYHNYYIPGLICGAGVDVPENVDNERFRKKYDIFSKYVIYIGRVDTGKNCEQLFDYFLRYKQEIGFDLKLVLLGKPVIPVPDDPCIISLGFVSDEDKFDALSGSEFLILPSKYESLSLVVLEAFSLSIPVLVNEECDVLKSHSELSNGGFYYRDYEMFKNRMSRLLQNDNLRKNMGIQGKKYIDCRYNWTVVIKKINSLIDLVISEK